MWSGRAGLRALDRVHGPRSLRDHSRATRPRYRSRRDDHRHGRTCGTAKATAQISDDAVPGIGIFSESTERHFLSRVRRVSSRAPRGGEGRGEGGIPERPADTTSPSQREAMGPSLFPLKGERDSWPPPAETAVNGIRRFVFQQVKVSSGMASRRVDLPASRTTSLAGEFPAASRFPPVAQSRPPRTESSRHPASWHDHDSGGEVGMTAARAR